MSVIAEQLSRVTIGAPMRHANLTLYPLLAEGVAEPGYRLLEAALADGSARVTEVSEEGSVPQLRFVNEGVQPVLLLDGEELIGAKQNRILNLTILAPAGKTITIPVSCVEQGRWHDQSDVFASAQRAHFATGRARKAADVSASLRQRGSRASDQGAVWRDIAEKSMRFGVNSATGAAADLYTAHRARLDAFRQAFAALPGQCGALFAIQDRVVGVELLDSPATLAAVLGKLIESYALDALDATQAAGVATTPQAWLEALAGAATETFAAVGDGEDWRLFGRGLTGGALVVDGRLIHLSAFAVRDDGDGDSDGDGDRDRGRGREATDDPDARAGSTTLELATDRRLIRWRGDSRRYLHLRLVVPHQSSARLPLDVALVLDRSGSMGGSKWVQARAAALAAIARLGGADRVALVVFDAQVQTLLPLAPAPAARVAAETALAGIGPRGGTDLAGGWLTGCGLVGEAGASERLRRCFLLTDGQANRGFVDPTVLAHHAGELRQRGVVTSTFGVGDDYDELLLGALADAGGGAFHDIAHAETIVPVLDRELGDALSVVHAEPAIELTWADDLAVEVLGPWQHTAGTGTLTIHPGDLVSDQVLDLLVAVRFPAGAQGRDCAMQVRFSDRGQRLAEAEWRWTWVDSARRQAQPRDRAVEQRVAQHWASQARLAASAANRAGDLEQARVHLRQGAETIARYGADDPEIQALAETLRAECERHRERQSPRVLKSAIYQERSIARGRSMDGGRRRGESS